MAILQIITVYILSLFSFLVPDLERYEHLVHVFIYYRSFKFLLNTTKTKIHISMPIKNSVYTMSFSIFSLFNVTKTKIYNCICKKQ